MCIFCISFENIGGIAQLGERLNGIQKVSGSIPLTSTKMKTADWPFFYDLSMARPLTVSFVSYIVVPFFFMA